MQNIVHRYSQYKNYVLKKNTNGAGPRLNTVNNGIAILLLIGKTIKNVPIIKNISANTISPADFIMFLVSFCMLKKIKISNPKVVAKTIMDITLEVTLCHSYSFI